MDCHGLSWNPAASGTSLRSMRSSRPRDSTRLASILLLAILSTGCGDTEDTSSDSEGTTPPITVDCETEAWDLDGEMAWKQAWMAACMLPEIAPLVQAIDPSRYADFSCTNCHGDDLAGGTYAMPGAIELDWAAAGTWGTDFYDVATETGAMTEVARTAALLLGYEPISPTNPTGFRCSNCHVGL